MTEQQQAQGRALFDAWDRARAARVAWCALREVDSPQATGEAGVAACAEESHAEEALVAWLGAPSEQIPTFANVGIMLDALDRVRALGKRYILCGDGDVDLDSAGRDILGALDGTGP